MDGLKIIRFKDRRLYISSMKERAWLHGAYPLSKSKWSFLYSPGSLILFPRSLSISLGQPQFLRFVTATVNDGGVGGAWPAHPGGTRNSSSRVVGMMVDWKKIVSAPSSSSSSQRSPFSSTPYFDFCTLFWSFHFSLSNPTTLPPFLSVPTSISWSDLAEGQKLSLEDWTFSPRYELSSLCPWSCLGFHELLFVVSWLLNHLGRLKDYVYQYNSLLCSVTSVHADY